jgi:threonine dehydrogenase-like Zn-dependent dehydrogenase
MRAFYVEADFKPKPGYRMTKRESRTNCPTHGNSTWKNIRGEVTDRPDPSPKENEVLIKIGSAGICETDAHMLRKDSDGYTRYDGYCKYPIITGHEFAGEIVEIGQNVENLEIGDLVSVEPIHWCGKCENCGTEKFDQCQNLAEPGFTFDGGFAEYAVADAKYCYLLNDVRAFYDDKIAAFELGAMVGPTGVAFNGLFVSGGGFRPGGHVVVFGAGPVGLAAISLLKTTGAAKIICFESTPARRELAKGCGADYVYDRIALSNADTNPTDLLMQITNGRGVSLFAECEGATNSVYRIMGASLAVSGKTIQIGRSTGKTNIDLSPFVTKGGSIRGTRRLSVSDVYSNVIALMASGRIDMSHMITHRVNLEEIKTGLTLASDDISGKILVSPDYPPKEKTKLL